MGFRIPKIWKILKRFSGALKPLISEEWSALKMGEKVQFLQSRIVCYKKFKINIF